MNKAIIGLLVLIALGLVAYKVSLRADIGNPSQAGSSAEIPPPDAVFLEPDVTAEMVMGAVAGIRKQADREAAAATFAGLWVGEAGWAGEVMDVTDERRGSAVRMQITSSGVFGGSFFLIAVISDPEADVRKGDAATVQGMVTKVEVLSTMPLPTHRIVLEPAKVLSVARRTR